jgi:HK97 family phage major capsid protein
MFKTRLLLGTAAAFALASAAFAAGESHTARQPGGLRAVVMDATALAEVRTLIGEVRTSIADRDKAMQAQIEKAELDVKNFGKISDEVKAELVKQVEASTAMQGRLQGIEQALAALKTEPNKAKRQTLGEAVLNDAKFKAWLGEAGSTPSGKIRVDVKNAVTERGSGEGAAGEIIIPQRIAGWVTPPNRILTIRDLLPQGRTTSNAVDFVQETGFTNSAAPVAEGAQKPESSLEFTLRTSPVRTIAHWLQASKQVLEDIPQLESYINTRLTYGLKLVEEEQLLAGDGTGQNLLGLIPQATPYDRTRSKVGDTRIDIVRRAMTQLRLSQYQPDAVVLHPTDWEDIELQKNTQGTYIWANPRGLLGPTLWGLPVVESTSLAPGEFLVGAFKIAAQIWDRDDVQVDISTEDRDNFIKNMVTIRVEERLALVVYRPESFIFGDFENDVSHP